VSHPVPRTGSGEHADRDQAGQPIDLPLGQGPPHVGPEHTPGAPLPRCRNPTRYLAVIENRLSLNISGRPPVEQISKP
jgi:hypothetical protein